MKKFIRFLLLFLLPVVSIAQQNFQIHGERNKFLGQIVYNPLVKVGVGNFDIISINRSFIAPPARMFDGDFASGYNPGNYLVWYPAPFAVDLKGQFFIDHIDIYDVNSGTSFTVSHGNTQNDCYNLTVDSTLILDQGVVRRIDIRKNCRWIGLKINSTISDVVAQNSKKIGPAEIKIYGNVIAYDAVPSIVQRPLHTFGHLLGFNQDYFTLAKNHPWPGSHFRNYEYPFKFITNNALPNSKYQWALNTQGINWDDTVAYYSSKNILSWLAFIGIASPQELYKPSYGSDSGAFDIFNKPVQYHQDPENPQNYKIWADFAFQYALRYGKGTLNASHAKVNLVGSNTVRVNLGTSQYMEPGNELSGWFTDSTKSFGPAAFSAYVSAIVDGHCGTLGADMGAINADPNFKIILPADADFGLDWIKACYYWWKTFRPDHSIPPGIIINVHKYPTIGGGQFVSNDKGIHPEGYVREGFSGVGIKEYISEWADWSKRYLPGVQIWWTEFGWDTNPYSTTGVPLLTQAQALAAPRYLNSFEMQASYHLRAYFEMMDTTSVDKMTIYSLNNYSNCDELVQRYSDVDDNTQNPGWQDQYSDAILYNTSGSLGGQYYWIRSYTSSGVNIATTTVGQVINLTFPKTHAYYQFPVSPGVGSIRDPADGNDTGGRVWGYFSNQTDSTITFTVAAAGPGGIVHRGSGTLTTWRLDAPYAKKLSWFAINNTYNQMDTTQIRIRDESTSEYRHYVYSNGINKEVHVAYLPTNTGNLITRSLSVGGRSNATSVDLLSMNGATSSLSIASGNVSVAISEIPYMFFCTYGSGNASPVANAGTDRSIISTSTTITGSGTDSDGTIASYLWTKVSGPSATLSGTTTTSLAVNGLTSGTYTFRLTVTDNLGATNSDDMVLTVSIANIPPVAAALGGTRSSSNASEPLYDNGSTDADGTIANVTWTKTSGPSVTFTNASYAFGSDPAIVTWSTSGTYVLRETVTDNLGATDYKEVTEVVTLSGNASPTANAGSDQSITTTTATISGSGSDSDGTIASYSWSKISGGTATLSGSSTSTLSLSGLASGSYTFRLTVTDNLGAIGTDDVNITVTIGGGGGGLTSSQLVVKSFHTALGGGGGHYLNAEVYLPVGYGNGTLFPVIVACHGQTEKRNSGLSTAANIAVLNNSGIAKYLSTGHDIPFVVIMPQIDYASFDSYDFSIQEPGLLTSELAQWAVDSMHGDGQRCHLTGLSYGGQTVCPSAQAYPNRWATCIPISTAPDGYPNADYSRAVFWWFHGLADGTYAAPANEVAYVDELNSHGAIPFTSLYTFFAGQGHSASVWDNVYNTTAGSALTLATRSDIPNNHAYSNIYTWMLQYKIVSGVVSLY
jgi:hypothetical protein